MSALVGGRFFPFCQAHTSCCHPIFSFDSGTTAVMYNVSSRSTQIGLITLMPHKHTMKHFSTHQGQKKCYLPKLKTNKLPSFAEYNLISVCTASIRLASCSLDESP